MGTPSHPELTTTAEQAEAGVLMPVARSSRFRNHPLVWFVVRRLARRRAAGARLRPRVRRHPDPARRRRDGGPRAQRDAGGEGELRSSSGSTSRSSSSTGTGSRTSRGDLGTSLASRRRSDVHRRARRQHRDPGAGRDPGHAPAGFLMGVWSGIHRAGRPTTRSPAPRSASSRCPSSSIGTVLVLFFAVSLRLAATRCRSSRPARAPLSTPEAARAARRDAPARAASRTCIRMVRAGVIEVMALGLRRDGAPERHRPSGAWSCSYALRNALAPTRAGRSR